MRPDASENSQINPSTIVRAARAAGSQPHLASGFQGCCKIATLHAGFGVIRGMSGKITTAQIAFLTQQDRAQHLHANFKTGSGKAQDFPVSIPC
jgi:hypothetical protein